MADEFGDRISRLTAALGVLADHASLERGIDVASAVLALLGEQELRTASQVIDAGPLKLPNAERQDTWFHQHPWMRGERAVFELLDSNARPIEARLYWSQKKGKAFVAGAVHFTKNWEDHDFTRSDEFKIGIDFFLAPDASSVLVVLSNRGNLRVLELDERLTNTQIEILNSWRKLQGITDREALHAKLWESFALQSVNKKFYEGVSGAFTELFEHLRDSQRDEEASKLFSSRLLGRLIFVWFLRKMGLVNESSDYFAPEGADQGFYYRERLERLFFQILDTPLDQRYPAANGSIDDQTPYLNGGLFAPRLDDWVNDSNLTFPDSFFSRLFDHFNKFNFTTDESTPEYEQIAIDPEMLGRVFESLLASQLDSTGEQARKGKGAFYTPREIVALICRETVRGYLESSNPDDVRARAAAAKLLNTSDQDWANAGSNSLRDIPPDIKSKFTTNLREIKTIDPACGSGAFPLGLLAFLSKIQLRLDPKLNPYELKFAILRDSIYGVDIEPMAVEISRLRAWLSLVVEAKNQKSVDPLPNLEFNFVAADSLVSLREEDLISFNPELQRKLGELRAHYFSANTPEQKTRAQTAYLELQKEDLLDQFDLRASQLKSFNPFNSDTAATFFDPEIMFGLPDGFDIVLGNPPYVDSEYMTKNQPEMRGYIRENYASARGNWDLFVPFIEHGLAIANSRASISYIVKNSLLSAPYGSEIRGKLLDEGLVSVYDFGTERVFESAAVDTCVFIVQKASVASVVTNSQLSSAIEVSSSIETSREEMRGAANWVPFFLSPTQQAVLAKMKQFAPLAELGVNATSAAIVSEAYEIAEVVEDIEEPSGRYFKLINTGTIDPFKTLWGERPTKYLGSVYTYPVVSESSLGAVSTTRLAQAELPKLVINGMGNVEAFWDVKGEYLAGKTTSIVFDTDPNRPKFLGLIHAIMNSSLGRFWFRANFLSGGMSGLNPKSLLTLPMPDLSAEDGGILIGLTENCINDPGSPGPMHELNEFVFKIYGVAASEIE